MINVLKSYLNQVREKKESAELAKEFEQHKSRIRTQNYIKVMNERIFPNLKESYRKQGLLVTPEQFLTEAHQMFCDSKRDGYLDDLNCVVTRGNS